jgi:hypothetical protein
MATVKHLFIVGAGFSWHAGLPLTTEFTQSLLDVAKLKLDGPSALIVQFLQKFVDDTFGHDPGSDPKGWPELEDLFTCIDLSANTGHHLGRKYSPSYLRTVRRALIVRLIRMLRQNYTRGRKRADTNWSAIEDFFSSVVTYNCAFLSMNWDTVIEEGLKRTQKISSFEYGCEASPVVLDKTKSPHCLIRAATTAGGVNILKPHGSANWLYCDACRRVYWLPPAMTQWIVGQLFRKSDWRIVKDVIGRSAESPLPVACPDCSASSLGTRLATFSYRKALDFPMHERSWDSAERLLRVADTWNFIGYSLPAADFEFKFLLKRVQLSRTTPPSIVLITGGIGAAATEASYRKFFGPGISLVFTKGLNDAARDHLHAIGALQTPGAGSPRKVKSSARKRPVS